MKKNQILPVFLLLASTCLAGSENNKENWQSHFNGISISSLHQMNGQPGCQVQDGEIAGTTLSNPSITLLTIVMLGVSEENQLPNTLSAQEKKQGWKLLFDGKTTKDWKGIEMDKFPDKGWKVVDGTLMSIANSPENQVKGVDIVSVERYSAFDFQFEFNFAEGANSGVKYFIGNGGPSIGLEYQILDDQRHPDAKMGVVGNRTLASLYDLIPADKQERLTKPAGEWNTGRIVVYPDNRVEHWLNGMKVVEYVRGSNIYKALVARSKYAGFEGFGMVKESPILLQYHGDKVRFRSLKIKKI